MKKSLFLPAAFVLLCQAISAQTIPVKTVTVFKNNQSLVYKSGKVPVKGGRYETKDLPRALFGTFWVTSPTDELASVFSRQDSVEVKETVNDNSTLLKANIGKKIRVWLSSPATVETGILEKVEKMSVPGYASSSYDYQRVTLRTATDNWATFNSTQIVRIDFFEEPRLASEPGIRYKKPEETLAVQFKNTKPEQEIGMLYLTDNLGWTPVYSLTLTEKGKSRLSLRAEIANDAEDLGNAELRLAVGNPNFAFASRPDWLVDFAGLWLSPYGRNQYLAGAQQLSLQSNYMRPEAYNYLDEAQVQAPGENFEGAQAEDFFFYTVRPGETMWAASDVGWQVGHSYIAYGPMLHGATATLYEGKPVGTPDAGAFWRVISQHRIPVLFTAPTAFRAIKKEDPDGTLIEKYDLSHFRALFLAGERCDPDTLNWAEDHLKVPVIDHWWQTETGWAIAGIPLGVERMPVKYGSTSKPMPGWNVQVLGADRQPVATGQEGALVMKLPMPPGAFTTLWNAEKRCRSAYYEENPGFYTTGDAGFIDEDGYIFVMGRVDDVINVAGHRLSTGAMEEVLASHPDVAECAVIGVTDPMKGELPLGFIVLKSGVTRSDEEITQEVIALVRERIGPVAAFKTSVVVKRLPKTRSGKILRGTMHKIADSAEYKVPATIDDPAILGEIEEALQTVGYARKD